MGYHLIETSGHGLSSNLQDVAFKGYVGGPGATMELKLKSCPELDFDVDGRNSDDEKITKGELLLRGIGITPGFYNTTDANPTNKDVDQDGWYHTGDIVEMLHEFDNAIQIIDKKDNLIKMSTGNILSPYKLEPVYN